MKTTLATLFCLFTSLTLMSQTTSSSISGHVSEGDNPISDAVVTIVHEPTGTHYYVFTNKNGNYVINNILVGGPYTVRFERLNYKTLIIKNVEAPIDETMVVDAILVPSPQRIEEVTIFNEGESSSMNINRSGTGILINSSDIDMLPSVSRNMYDVLRLTPQGVSTESGASFGGANYRGSYITVDGASFNNSFGIGSSLPADGTPISLESIEQISVNITPYNVRHSSFQGASINMVTKHGANKISGSVYNYFTNNILHGYRVGDYRISNAMAIKDINGFTVGGPIIKDKLFFFINGEFTFDYESARSVNARYDEGQEYGGSSGFNRPTVEQMEEIQNFLDSRLDYQPGRFQNYTVSSPDFNLFARFDWRINDYNLLLLRISHTSFRDPKTPSSSFSPLGGSNLSLISDGELYTVNRNSAGRNSQYAIPFESAHYYQSLHFTSMTAEINSHILNGRGNNIARLTWSRQNEPRDHFGSIFPTVDILEPYIAADGSRQLALFTTFGPDPFTYGNLRRVNTITLSDEFNYRKGIHNILAGAQFEWNRIMNGFMQGGAGWYVYDSWQSFVDDVNDEPGATGPSLFMMTHANTATPSKQVFPTFDYAQASLYVQDDIEFSKFFKLTAGLRLEMPFIWYLYDNRNAEFDQIANAHPNSSFAGLSTADIPKSTVHVSPRVGFNWDITHKRNIILRGGTGLFTGRIPNVWIVSAVGNSNCVQYQYIANLESGQAAVDFDTDMENIIQSIHNGHDYSQTGLPAPTNATILAKDLRMPTSWKSSLALDIEIPGDIMFTLEGIYSFNFNEIYASLLGYKEAGAIQLPGEPEARTSYTSEGITNREGSYMRGYYLHNVKDLHGQYFSLTAQLAKEFDFGLNVMAAYTYSYATTLSDGSGDQVSSFANTPNVNDCNSPEIGLTGYVAPHRVLAHIGYTINEGKRTATKLGLFYEGLNMGFYDVYFMSRRSYLIENVSGLTSPQLMYIPTAEELAAMPFVSEENRAAFEEFINSEKYLSKHRGSYSMRNCGIAPWVNRIDFKVAQEIYFNPDGHKQTLTVGLDLRNLANLLNRKWSAYKSLDNDVVLKYENGQYTFTPSTWSYVNNLSSTWQILVVLKYTF